MTAWRTAITRIEPNHVRVRGYDIGDLMGRVSFGGAVHLILTGELPDAATAKLIDAVLVSSIDHGATPPSTLAARTVASTGGALGQAVAAGILCINRSHGGAIEECARQLGRIVARHEETGEPMDRAARSVLDELKAAGERMSGFGHRVHTDDPRTARLFELAEAAASGNGRAAGRHVAAARAVEAAFRRSGKPLPINVDGAIAAILADVGFAPQGMNAFFMIARVPGLVAHALEEQSREKPMRQIDPTDHAYDGPAARALTP
jgi:citrate synthase